MEKEIERLTRDNNLLKAQIKEMTKKEVRAEKKLCYLIQRDKILTSLENSLPKRIENYKSKNAPKQVIAELNKIYELLMAQKTDLKGKIEENK